MRKLGLLTVGCISLLTCGCTHSLSTDCNLFGVALEGGTQEMKKLYLAERSMIDAEIDVTGKYCAGTLPADPAAAMVAVESSTSHITAVFTLAAMRK